MRTLGNLIWHFPFMGFLVSGYFFILGCILCITIIGAPLGTGFFKISKMLLWPFGNCIVRNGQYGLELAKNSPDKNRGKSLYRKYTAVFRIIWFPFGILTSGLAIVLAIVNAITIINIPIALILIDIAKVSFNPTDVHVVDIDLINAAKSRQAKNKLEKLIA